MEAQVSSVVQTANSPRERERNRNVEIAVAEVARVAELANYQNGSVVSRILIRRDKGNVTLFAFDEGQELSEHTAPFDALAYVLEGMTEIRIAGEPFNLGVGDVILMPANQPHAVRAISQFKMLLTMIRSS